MIRLPIVHAFFFVFLPFLVVGCSDETEPPAQADAQFDFTEPDPNYVRSCQQGDYLYDDQACNSNGACQMEGDGKCYARCETNADCDEPQRPVCVGLPLYQGGDALGNGCERVCMAEELIYSCG